jgi:predicted RNase H-like nuclease (RuvC/YqgF family)
MQRIFLKNLTIALALLVPIGLTASAQSLGDVARENREKKADTTSAAQPKVIRNKDLPKDPEADPVADQAATAAQPASVPNKSPEQSAADRRAEQRFAQQRLAEQRAAEQWKRQILAQKDKIAALQSRIDHLKATLQFADVSVYPYAGPYNRDQARQLRRITQLQQQLDEQQRKLDQMKEAARHAGMHTAVYDP